MIQQLSHKCIQFCQLSDFSDPFSDFFFKAPSDKSSDFWKNLSNFPNVASTVLRARDIELHLSLCLLWSVSAGSGWEKKHIPVTARQLTIDVNELRMCTQCCHGPITCLLLLRLKYNYLIWPFFSSASFFLTSCTYITHCHRALVLFQFLKSSQIAYWAMSERLYVIVLTHTQQ